MNEIIERLKKCFKTGTPMLLRPEEAAILLVELGIREE